jgi:hypothetical protein
MQNIYVPNLYHILILLRYIIKLRTAHKTVIELQQCVRTTKRMWFFLAQKAATHDMCESNFVVSDPLRLGDGKKQNLYYISLIWEKGKKNPDL